MLKIIELFAGIRAFSLASEWIGGFETVEAVEINSYCNEKMLKRYPNVPIHEDIRTYHPAIPADVIVGEAHVKVTAKQEKVKAQKTHAQDLSLSSFELFKNLCLDLSFGKMSTARSLVDSLEKPSPNSIDLAMDSMLKSYQQRRLERPTKEKGSLWLPTPTALSKPPEAKYSKAGQTKLDLKLRSLGLLDAGKVRSCQTTAWIMGFSIDWLG
jgi:hypothetical protein